MIRKKDSQDYVKITEGVSIKTTVHGEKTLMAEFRLLKGYELPSHEHPNEQTGYLVSGKLRLYVGDDSYEVNPGDSWNIPGNVTHKAEILEDSTAIEVFAPARDDYLKYV